MQPIEAVAVARVNQHEVVEFPGHDVAFPTAGNLLRGIPGSVNDSGVERSSPAAAGLHEERLFSLRIDIVSRHSGRQKVRFAP